MGRPDLIQLDEQRITGVTRLIHSTGKQLRYNKGDALVHLADIGSVVSRRLCPPFLLVPAQKGFRILVAESQQLGLSYHPFYCNAAVKALDHHGTVEGRLESIQERW
ncbi:hypothetical protein ACQY0O_001032 [Thecaphora frezii]